MQYNREDENLILFSRTSRASSSREDGYLTPGIQSFHILLPKCSSEPQTKPPFPDAILSADRDRQPARAVPAEKAPAFFRNSLLVFILRSLFSY
jgi:hypothetical protein